MALQVGTIPVTAFQQNCALVWDDETRLGVVVDPGGDVAHILAAIEQTGISVTDIFITHGHMDHAGGAAELSEALDLRITGPAIEDKFLLDDMENAGRRFGLIARNCKPDHWLKDGEIIHMGGAEFEVRHCPGHTPGHVVFINHEQKFGIFGDVLFHNSVGRTDLGDYGNTEQLMTSIRTKLLTLPDDFSFICGHGPGSTIGEERRSNPFLRG
ncbi:MAG: MBL fold metallo-hydrolase [Acidocella sp.]|nr:MBL fold metallo-hydrolase [Acidocella sp.]